MAGAVVPATSLTGVSETLLVPLAARALADELNPDLGFYDPRANEIVGRIGFDVGRFSGDRASMRGALVRAQTIDLLARRFFERHPDSLGVDLGAGLDTRFHRVDNGRLAWIDVDLPAVTDLKRTLVAETERYRLLAGSITDRAWMDAIGWAPGRPVFICSEGVLCYLEPGDVKALLVGAAERFDPGTEIAFDFFHPIAVRHSRHHPSVKKTTARFRWGIKDVRTIAAWHPKLYVANRFEVMERCGPFQRLFARAFRLVTGGQWFYGVAQVRLVLVRR